MLKQDFFRAGLELQCEHCNLINWLTLKDLDDTWLCRYCGDPNKTSLQLATPGDWKFRKSGLLAKDNNQEGAIPVMLTLLALQHVFDFHGMAYSFSLNLKKQSEIDFCVLPLGRAWWERRTEIGIGESKSAGGRIDQNDVDNLKAIAADLKKLELLPCLIFSKTANAFDADEIQRFKQIESSGTPCVLLTNKELELYDFYSDEDDEQLPHKNPHSLREMAENSKSRYLR